MTRTSEESFSLSQAAERATSQQALPEVVTALGRLAEAGVEVSNPGIGHGERNAALMPISYQKQVA